MSKKKKRRRAKQAQAANTASVNAAALPPASDIEAGQEPAGTQTLTAEQITEPSIDVPAVIAPIQESSPPAPQEPPKTHTIFSLRAAAMLIALSIALFAGGGFFSYRYYHEYITVERMRDVVYTEFIYPGVTAEGIELGGLTQDEAKEKLNNAAALWTKDYIIYLTVQDDTWLHDLAPVFDTQAAAAEAFAVGREGALDERYATVLDIAANGYTIDIPIELTAQDISSFVSNIGEELYKAPVNSEFSYFDADTGEIHFTQDQIGFALPAEEIQQSLEASINAMAFPIKLTSSLCEIPPEITQKDAGEQMRLLASFTTTTTKSSSRNTNITLASQSFHGAVIQPGETFSINESTGKRTTALGYRKAGAIRDGRSVSEVGGGVCQVSTTLFNAAVRAGLSITERHNHSYPIRYVPKGHDAMINYPTSDLKITNNGEGPVILASYFENYELTIEVYGMPILPPGVTVELYAKPASTSVTTYIQYIKDGEIIDEQVLFQSRYRSSSPL